MDNNFFDRYAKLCKAIGETPNSIAKIIGASSGSVTAWKKGTEPRYSTVVKIADYLDTTVDYLLGRTNDSENSDRFGLEDPADDAANHSWSSKKAPTNAGERKVSDDDIKFALFGGDGEITDEMFDEVKRFAEMVKLREDTKKKKEQ